MTPGWMWLWGLACSPELAPASVGRLPGGVDVLATAPITQVRVGDGSRVLAVRRSAGVTERVFVDTAWSPGEPLWAEVRYASGRVETLPIDDLAIGTPVTISALGLGQLIDGTTTEVVADHVALAVTSAHAGTLWVQDHGQTRVQRAVVAGERVVVDVAVPGQVRAELDGAPVNLELVRARGDSVALVLSDVAFPAMIDGRADPAQAPGRIGLPSRWWDAVVRASGLSYRPADHQAAWGTLGVKVHNPADHAVDAVVRLSIRDGAAAAWAFRPRLREANGEVDAVASLVRIPAAGDVTVALPVWVDRSVVVPGAYSAAIAVTLVGAETPSAAIEAPFAVTRGSAIASGGALVSLVVAVIGLGGALMGYRRWMRTVSTSTLTTIALFGSLQLVVGVASQLFATIVTTAIGPLAPIVTGLVDESLRAALLVALITLLPRPGVIAATIAVGYLLRLLALGSFSPIDGIWLGVSIALYEGLVWLSGPTRLRDFASRSRNERRLRIATGLALASLGTAASALCVHVLAYRLFYAPWYLIMVLAGPSFLYVVFAAWLAVPFADSLREVES